METDHQLVVGAKEGTMHAPWLNADISSTRAAEGSITAWRRERVKRDATVEIGDEHIKGARAARARPAGQVYVVAIHRYIGGIGAPNTCVLGEGLDRSDLQPAGGTGSSSCGTYASWQAHDGSLHQTVAVCVVERVGVSRAPGGRGLGPINEWMHGGVGDHPVPAHVHHNRAALSHQHQKGVVGVRDRHLRVVDVETLWFARRVYY